MLMAAKWTFLASRAWALLRIVHDLEVCLRDVAASRGTPNTAVTLHSGGTVWPCSPRRRAQRREPLLLLAPSQEGPARHLGMLPDFWKIFASFFMRV